LRYSRWSPRLHPIQNLFGVSLGWTLMLVLIGLGLGNVFLHAAQIYTVLKYVGTVYLLYLAWKIARSGAMESGAEQGKPLSFMQAALFNGSTPKPGL
jgi:threonine/homoserine/homoserine lactone efflux protein